MDELVKHVRDHLSQVKPTRAVLGAIVILLLTKSGRLYLKGYLAQALSALSIHVLPRRLVIGSLRRAFHAPLWYLRSNLNLVTTPAPKYRGQYRPVQGKNWKGHWIGQSLANSRASDVTQWVSASDVIVLYFHGGGFVSGHSLQYMAAFSKWQEVVKAKYNYRVKILSVDYDLAPEHKWPKQNKQCMVAYKYLIKDMKVNPEKIIIAGDSAGGNLTVMLTLDLEAHHLPLPRGIVMISPWVNFSTTSASLTSNGRRDYISKSSLQQALKAYLPANRFDELLTSPDASPFNANLASLPPTLITYGGYEIFRDDVKAFAERCKDAGALVQVLSHETREHDWVVDPVIAQTNDAWEYAWNTIGTWTGHVIRGEYEQ
ncbi:hypothetical protein BZG36_02043 [Bifiguratus adelaidae]|uniref:Alpha/beta hydrolase fold-3 domain-containing protein n=1 Tax=Bifiguratus adelaidae TaxID=1938954 RepID=A0A261Y207_9FUNG|nr:hypothetical protein BZG36_02043 [Bifiguratus adelaidae]